MIKRTAIVLLLLLSFYLLANAQTKDTLFMNNGQILIGELKSLSLGKINFDSDDLTILSIKTNKIKTIAAKSHIYRLETIRRKIFYVQLEPADSGRVYVLIGTKRQLIAFDYISSIMPLQGKTGVLWEGSASMGYSYSRSSDIGQLNADFSVGYLSRKVELDTKGSAIMSQTDSAFEINNSEFGIFGSYLFTPMFQGITFLNYQHNLELGLERRYQEGFALGVNFKSSVHIRLRAMSGIVFNQEKNTEGVKTPTQLEVPVMFFFNFFKFRKPDMTISSKQSIFTSLTQKGRFRHDGEINLSIKIITDFSITLKLYDNFDNQPPGENARNFDYGTVFGLTYKFSQ